MATLTGAMVLALGDRTFGIMANDDAFRTAVARRSREEAGEDSWPMPLPAAACARRMDSPTADLANMGVRMGGGLVAGLFLQEFVGEGITWAHLDIAGPAFHEGAPYGYTPKGGTGSAVRTLVPARRAHRGRRPRLTASAQPTHGGPGHGSRGRTCSRCVTVTVRPGFAVDEIRRPSRRSVAP